MNGIPGPGSTALGHVPWQGVEGITVLFAQDLLQTLGVVRGIVVRSRNVFATLGAAFQQVVGGNITIWTRMCEETRRDAFDIMIQHASEIGANAIVGVRYDTTEIATGVTEVLCYGTAVIVEPTDAGYRG